MLNGGRAHSDIPKPEEGMLACGSDRFEVGKCVPQTRHGSALRGACSVGNVGKGNVQLEARMTIRIVQTAPAQVGVVGQAMWVGERYL